MKKNLFVTLSVVLCVAMFASLAVAKTAPDPRFDVTRVSFNDKLPANPVEAGLLYSGASQGTTFLASWSFDQAGSCVDMGWIQIDATDQSVLTSSLQPQFFHTDDFAGVVSTGGVTIAQSLEGTYSLWGGWRASPTDASLCGYATLPGYGNGQDYGYCTDICLMGLTGDVVVDYLVQWDSEVSYDGTGFDADIDCDGSWTPYVDDGGLMTPSVAFGTIYNWSGGPSLNTITIPVADHSGDMQLRWRFRSDGGWGDQDGLWDTDGPIILDSLTVYDQGGANVVLATEDYETEGNADPNLAGDGVDWSECTTGIFGSFHDLSKASNILQEDPCFDNFTCVWSYFKNSPEDYSCGGHVGVLATPKIQGDLVLVNEIWSPEVPNAGAGVQYEVQAMNYLDLPQDNLVYYTWKVRYRTPDGTCLTTWTDRNFVYYDGTAFDGLKQWAVFTQPVGDLIDPLATHVQMGLGVQDMCIVWCGTVGSGNCHSHAPLQDNARIYRIDTAGPQFNVNDGNQFQDTFESPTLGTGRMDQGFDRLPPTNPTIFTGDSATVVVADPADSLLSDPFTGTGKAVYAYVSIWPPNQPGKAGVDIEEVAVPNVSGYQRWPVVDSLTHNGQTWYCVRADSSFTGRGNGRTGAQPDRFCVDLNDNMFEAGDTLCFIWAATSQAFNTTYWTPLTGMTPSMTLALDNPGEATILPAGGVARGGDILYIDGGGGTNEQRIFEESFNYLGIVDQVDRFDVRQPSSGLGNRPGNRVFDVADNILPFYRKIIWNTGTDGIVIGDGTTNAPDKSPDVQLMANFLDGLATTGGMYISGDEFAEALDDLTFGGLLKFFINYDLTFPNAARAGFGIAPLCIGTTTGIFQHAAIPDSLIAYGGCPFITRFDVLEPTGADAKTQMTYGVGDNAAVNGESTNSAVISQVTNNGVGQDVGVVLSGFSYHIIANIEPTPVPIRVDHLRDILGFLDNQYDDPSGVNTSAYRNSLSQNYPNPFNPQTTINFTVKEQANVSLRIYNVAGQLVRSLVDEAKAPGVAHTVVWDGRNNAGSSVSSGVYFYKLVTSNFTQTKKMVLLK